MKKCLLYLVLLLVGSLSAMAQTITGTVTSSPDGATLPGVSVIVKGTTTGTSTDASGKFTLNVPNQQSILVVSFIGYSTQEVAVGARTEINIQLAEDIAQLNEVVVTAIGIEREKKALGYAITEVNGEDLSTVKDRNFASNLVGRVPGLVATQSSSGPGGGTRIVIRGNASLGGNNQPLFVVDGVPIDNSGFGSSSDNTNTGAYSRADYGTGLSDINPDDIESVTVLKGPNAAALYGSRAANGVIMVTTKKGRSNQGLGISYSTNYTVESPLVLPKYQNKYGQGENGTVPIDLTDLQDSGSWGAVMDGSQKLYWTGEQRPYSPQPNNVEDFFQQGSTFINSIALDGGSDKFSTRFSYTNNQSKGIIPNSDLTKNNFNLRTVVKLTDKFSLDAKATVFYQSAKNRAVQGTEGIMSNLFTIPRNTVLDDLKDYQYPNLDVREPTSLGGNPYWVVNHDINEDTRSRVMGYAKLNYEFTDYLSAFVRIGTDATRQKIETVNQPGHWYYKTGRFNFSDTHVSETNADFLLMFNKEITSDFQLGINVGGNHRYQTYERQSLYGENFKIPTKATVESALITTPSYTPLREKVVNSVYGSAQLAYKEIVYLDLSARNDWSSTLPKDNWSYFYPSASLAVLVNEFIDPNQSTLDFLKVRLGWAQVGNDTDPYQLTNAYLLQQDGYLGETTLSRPSTLYDENLKPEQISTFEIGFESKFLGNRIYADFSYYNIVSKDLIWNVPVIGSTGYSLFHTNVGQMTNKGFEFVIGGIPVMTQDFTWDASLNFSKNNNTFDEILGDLDWIELSNNNSSTVRVQGTVGGGYGDIYGTTYQRVNGEIEVDAAGRPVPTSEKVYLGNYQPKWTAGFINNFSYKNFSLRMLIDMRYGGQAYVGTDAGMDASGVSKKTLQYREEDVIVKGVENTGTDANPVYEPNTNAITGQQYWGAYSGIASNYVYDQTNVRMRELTLIYNFPTGTLGNFIKGASLGIVGRNLFFFSRKMDNFDPESSFSTGNTGQGVLFYNLPTTRSLGFNLNVKF